MANSRRVTFVIGANIKNFTKGLNSAQRKFRKFGKDLKRTGRSLTRNITAPLGILGGIAVKTAADFESLRQSMDILNGSAEEGARNFERLKRFSAETPFQLQDLAEAQNMLQGFSLSADEAFESMSMIGDIAAVTGGDIKGIGIAFGQAAAEGRLMTRDIRQLINQGVPAIQLLADTMDVATSEVLDLASEGKITFDILVQAFKDATSEGGMFADGMEKQAQTLAGVWSTLKDNVSIALGELGTTIEETFNLKQLAKDVTSGLRVIVRRFQEMSTESRKQVVKVAGLFMAGGPILIALGQAAIAVSAFSKLVRTRFFMITAAAGLVAGTIEQQRQLWSKLFTGTKKDVDNFTTSAQKGIMKVIGPVMDFAEETIGAGSALDNFQSLLSNLGEKNPDEALNDIVSGAKDAGNAFSDLNTLLGEGTGGGEDGGGGFGFTFSSPIDKVTEFTDRVRDLPDIYGKSVDSMKASGAEFATVTEAAIGKSLSNWEKFNATVKNVSEEVKTQAIQQIQSAVISFGTIIGKTLVGVENSFATTFEKIALVMIDFAKSLLKLAAGIGSLMLFIPGMQAAGAGILAASAALQAIVSGVEAGINKRASNRQDRRQDRQGMAMGGIIPSGFPNDTYPAMLSSGETVIPSPKPLPSGMGGKQKIENHLYIDGREVEVALEDRKYGRNR